MSRDEAATAVGIQRRLAAFHLDKLAGEGLVDVEFRRLTGRTGPGAGRPSKLYRPASEEHAVTLPPRSYALVAELLAAALAARAPGGTGEAPEEIAERNGRAIGREARERLGSRPPAAQVQSTLDVVLATLGYHPSPEGRTRRLRNCPFHAVAERHRDLVCGMNVALLGGVLDGLGVRRLEARLEPAPDACCVVLAPPARRRSG